MALDGAEVSVRTIKKKITDKGMGWVMDRNVALMETRITPKRHTQV
jgi:hypothetical protein